MRDFFLKNGHFKFKYCIDIGLRDRTRAPRSMLLGLLRLLQNHVQSLCFSTEIACTATEQATTNANTETLYSTLIQP
jgi:hypothetical protein